MSMLIKGMEMPKNFPDLSGMNKATIYNCKIFVDSKGGAELRFCGKDYPLIVVPTSHGRLIDADALPIREINHANYPSNYIKIAPTIIEAEVN